MRQKLNSPFASTFGAGAGVSIFFSGAFGSSFGFSATGAFGFSATGAFGFSATGAFGFSATGSFGFSTTGAFGVSITGAGANQTFFTRKIM